MAELAPPKLPNCHYRCNRIRAVAIACLECGQKLKILKRHLGTDDGTTPTEYRAEWNLASDHPMVAPDCTANRNELAPRIGPGRKPGHKVAKKTAPAASPPTRKKAPAATAS